MPVNISVTKKCMDLKNKSQTVAKSRLTYLPLEITHFPLKIYRTRLALESEDVPPTESLREF